MKSMHHIFTSPFQNCFWISTQCIFQNFSPSVFGLNVPSWTKEILFQRTQFQNSLKDFPFSKESCFSSIFNLFWIQILSTKWFENQLPSKMCYKIVSKRQKFCFSSLPSTKYFQTKYLSLKFCFKKILI